MFEVAALAIEVEETDDTNVERTFVTLVGGVGGFESTFQLNGGEVKVQVEFPELHVAVVDGPVLEVALGVHLGRDDYGRTDVDLILDESHGAAEFQLHLAAGVSG